MPRKLTKNQVKASLLEGRKVTANNWEISINERDEVVIFPPKGNGFSATLAHLDRAVDDYCKKANTEKPGVSSRRPRRSEVTVGPDSETENLLKSPSIKRYDIPSGGVKPDMVPGSESDQPYTPKPRDKSPEAGPAPGEGGMPSTELGSDSEGDIKFGRHVKAIIPDDTFDNMASDPSLDEATVEELLDITESEPNRDNYEDLLHILSNLDAPWALDLVQEIDLVSWVTKHRNDYKDYESFSDFVADVFSRINQALTQTAYSDIEESERGIMGKHHIRDTFADGSDLTDYYRELKAKKPSAELLKDITNERKWVANNQSIHPKGGEKKKATLFYNTNPLYGDEGPHEAANKEELADMMADHFDTWADEELDEIEYQREMDESLSPLSDIEYDQYKAKIINRMRREFMDGLEEVSNGRESNFKLGERKKAGPKLREKWDDAGSYHRDIEAESPEELHALTRAFGGEEVDWSSFRKEPDPVEAEESMDEVVARRRTPLRRLKRSQADIEAVDDKAKDYYDKYFSDSDYGKKMTKDDITDKRKRNRDKDEKKDKLSRKRRAQAAPAPAPRQPAAPQAVPPSPGAPTSAPAAPAAEGAPPTPGTPKPKAPAGADLKPGAGDAGLQALGWTPEDIQLLDEDDKQKILQVQLNRPGTKPPATPGAPPKGAPAPSGPSAPMAGPAPGPAPAPGAPASPAAPAPQKPVPAPVAAKMARDILKKIKFRKAQRMLLGQEIVTTEEPAAPVAPPAQSPMPEFQSKPSEGDTGENTIDQRAFQILSEVQQMPVQATTPESVPPMKAQELSRRLLTEIGMPIEEAKTLFGVSKSNQGLISLFK